EAPTAEPDALRTFRVDRIEDVPELGEPGAYDLPQGFRAEDELRLAPFVPRATTSDTATPAGPTEVTIDVDVREAWHALGLVGAHSRIDGASEGSIRLRFAVADEEAFLSWILGLGDAVVVIEPASMRSLVIEHLRLFVSGDSRGNNGGDHAKK